MLAGGIVATNDRLCTHVTQLPSGNVAVVRERNLQKSLDPPGDSTEKSGSNIYEIPEVDNSVTLRTSMLQGNSFGDDPLASNSSKTSRISFGKPRPAGRSASDTQVKLHLNPRPSHMSAPPPVITIR